MSERFEMLLSFICLEAHPEIVRSKMMRSVSEVSLYFSLVIIRPHSMNN